MLLDPVIMRWLLLTSILGMALLAGFYLSRRSLTREEYIGWGLLIVLLPLIGPFLVILSHPGTPRKRRIP